MDYEVSDFIKIIKRQFILIITIIILSVLITGLISFYALMPVYEAEVTLIIQSLNANSSISYNDLITNEKLIFTYENIIKSKKIAQDVINRLNLEISVDELLKKITAKGINDSLLTIITATDSNPEMAVAIANEFAKSFKENLPQIMKVENISILDEANLENPKPVSPKPFFNMTVALLLSLNLSIGIAILIEILDKTIKTERDLEKLINSPVLGVISKRPRNRSEKEAGTIFYLNEPNSQVAETFRTLRTNIKYLKTKQEIQTLLVTSPQPHEGKTTIITNLAVAIAQEGKKVLLIDCDLRRPNLHKIFEIPQQGLTNILINELGINDAVINTKINNLFILPSGPIPPNPAELLGTQLMPELIEELKKKYDFILIDSSPILPVTDGQILAKLSDAVILIVKSRGTLAESVLKANYLLNHVGGNLIGAVLNNKKVKTNYYYY